jgi:hypothetical protein
LGVIPHHFRDWGFQDAPKKSLESKKVSEIISDYLTYIPIFIFQLKPKQGHNKGELIASTDKPVLLHINDIKDDTLRTNLDLYISSVESNWKPQNSLSQDQRNEFKRKVDFTLKKALEDYIESVKNTTQEAIGNLNPDNIPPHVLFQRGTGYIDYKLHPTEKELIPQELGKKESVKKENISASVFIREVIKKLPKTITIN